jgi:hypothetical protein
MQRFHAVLAAVACTMLHALLLLPMNALWRVCADACVQCACFCVLAVVHVEHTMVHAVLVHWREVCNYGDSATAKRDAHTL